MQLGVGVKFRKLGHEVQDHADQRRWVRRVRAVRLGVLWEGPDDRGLDVLGLVVVRVAGLGHDVNSLDGGQRSDDGEQLQQSGLGERQLVDDGFGERAALQHLADVLQLVAGHVGDVVADDVMHEVVLAVVVVVRVVVDEDLVGGGRRHVRLGGGLRVQVGRDHRAQLTGVRVRQQVGRRCRVRLVERAEVRVVRRRSFGRLRGE